MAMGSVALPKSTHVLGIDGLGERQRLRRINVELPTNKLNCCRRYKQASGALIASE